MKIHGNARTCPNSRKLLVHRIEVEGWSLVAAAEAAGISERSVRKWLGRWRAEGEPGLLDRSSAPKRVPSRLPDDRLAAIEALRRLRMTAAEIAEVLGMALSTVSRWLARIGLGKRRQQRRRPPGSRCPAAPEPGEGRPQAARGDRLGVRPRLRRRRHPPRLRRGPARREGRHRRRLFATRRRLVRGHGDHG
jgi:transposase